MKSVCFNAFKDCAPLCVEDIIYFTLSSGITISTIFLMSGNSLQLDESGQTRRRILYHQYAVRSPQSFVELDDDVALGNAFGFI